VNWFTLGENKRWPHAVATRKPLPEPLIRRMGMPPSFVRIEVAFYQITPFSRRSGQPILNLLLARVARWTTIYLQNHL